jgi:S-DNA-T family DNA segregation ATPase FtsK/SpoIIIE
VDHCEECGYTYADHGTDSVAGEIAGLGARYRVRLAVPPGDAGRRAALLRRPVPEVWSAIECGCHVRDVLLAQRERLFQALVEPTPPFVPIYRDRRAVLARYAEEDPERVADAVDVAAHLIAWAFSGLAPTDWDRTCIHNFPEPAARSILWLAEHTLHEGEHHLGDIDRTIAAAG